LERLWIGEIVDWKDCLLERLLIGEIVDWKSARILNLSNL